MPLQVALVSRYWTWPFILFLLLSYWLVYPFEVTPSCKVFVSRLCGRGMRLVHALMSYRFSTMPICLTSPVEIVPTCNGGM